MKSSSSAAPAPSPVPDFRPYPYPEASGQASPGHWHSAFGLEAGMDEVGQKIEAARAAGKLEGEKQVRAAYEAHLEQIRDSVRSALSDFVRQRDTYFQAVEAEVVQLALAIAKKILHREAQLDPMLLAGMVRVALEKIERGTKVVVRVNPQQVSECRAYFAQHMEPGDVPEVVEDPALETDRSLLETSLGSAELGPSVQLKEIERGLLDLLAQRPESGS